MIWTAKGHQFDAQIESVTDIFNKRGRKFVLYGAGMKGRQAYLPLKRYGCFGGFIDADRSKQLQGYLGEKVYSLESFLECGENRGWVVITASVKNQDVIEKELRRGGLSHGTDYLFGDELFDFYFPLIASYLYDSCFLSLCQISLTERCTLSCENCAHGCYNVPKDAPDLPWEDFRVTLDTFFKKVDYIKEFVLIGGEPLLYGRMAEAITYIGEKYRRKIGTLSITTNSTIIPNMDVIKASQAYDVFYEISNYSKGIPQLKNRQDELISLLDNYGIRYWITAADGYWLDYGFETVNHKKTENEMAEFFDRCATPCREIRGNRFYYCVMARSVSENLGMNIGAGDYLDFDALEGDYKKVILEYNLGCSERGFLEMCRHCNGSSKINQHKIPVARQLRRGEFT